MVIDGRFLGPLIPIFPNPQIFQVLDDVNVLSYPLFSVIAIQMLRFPINPFPSMPWSDQGLGSSLFTVLQPLWFQATPDPSPSSIVINANEIYIISIVWTILFVGLFLFAMFLYSRVSYFICYASNAYRLIHRFLCRKMTSLTAQLHTNQVGLCVSFESPFV